MTEKIFVTSCVIFAIYGTMIKGMIFDFISDYVARKFSTGVQKIVYDCPICMCPYYGSVFYWLVYHNSVKEWIIVIIASMGLNTIIIKFLRNH